MNNMTIQAYKPFRPSPAIAENAPYAAEHENKLRREHGEKYLLMRKIELGRLAA